MSAKSMDLVLLIEPFGIEMVIHALAILDEVFLLIEPFGIEISP